MFFIDGDGVNVIQFGTGDILIGAGMLDDPENMIGAVALIPQEPVGIGVPRDLVAENGGIAPADTDFGVHTRLVFTKPESIDVLVEHLLAVKEAMLND